MIGSMYELFRRINENLRSIKRSMLAAFREDS